MNGNDDINNFIPSLLNPRGVRKDYDISLSQRSVLSRASLSLRRPKALTINKLNKSISNKENLQDLKTQKSQTPSLIQKSQIDIKTRNSKKFANSLFDEESIQNIPNTEKEKADEISIIFSFLQDKGKDKTRNSKKFANSLFDEESIKNIPNTEKEKADEISISFSFLQDKGKDINNTPESTDTFFYGFGSPGSDVFVEKTDSISNIYRDLDDNKRESTLQYTYSDNISEQDKKPSIQIYFGVKDSKVVNVTATNGAISKFSIARNKTDTDIACEVIENSQISTDTEVDENMNETSLSPLKRPAVEVNLEIKKRKLTRNDSTEDSKVLILKTDAIEKISHGIVQPPNYTFVKRNLTHKRKHKKAKLTKQNGTNKSDKLKQSVIESYFRIGSKVKLSGAVNDVSKEMSKNSGAIESAKCDRGKRSNRRELELPKSPRRELNESPKSARLPSKKDIAGSRRQDVKSSNSEAPSPRIRNESLSAHTPRKNVESLHFNLPVKSKSNRTSLSPRNIPHHKIVAGTHFAVDAFSYGDIPNVKHYFLTHFHSDHYSGLKKSFNKLLFCSKITADLCISRLGVNPKNIRIINVDEVLRIEGVEVAAVDANHCPGALMLIFTLPNGKTLLHTGDFRACPAMESYPVFWNKDVHTVYLDTTYCNPRYDFPTQDQSLEMALYILRQKKSALENAGKKFSSVLIVCGTYTIGKEKFFLGMSRRVGCAVWACPEKERVLQVVEGRPCSRDAAAACQLHVVPMRDLTHEKLRTYLDSLSGAFSEVVAFKPSGWENGKNSSVEKDLVTIHGIPYSEHSSFSELIRFIKFLTPKQVVPTVDISGGVKSVQKYFKCPLVYQQEQCQARVTDYYSIPGSHHTPAVT